MTEFDVEGVFGEDYLHFYTERLSPANSDDETDLIVRVAGLAPGEDELDLACGHGRIANRLAARGCRVTGLDAVPLFLDRARADAAELGVEVDYRQGDMRELPWTERFDAVVNWFTAFGYFDDDGNRAVLAEVARALRPGGRLTIEVSHFPWLMRNFRPSNVVERDGDMLIDRHEFDPLTNRINVRRTTVRDGLRRDTHYVVRLITFPELRSWLLAAGFSEARAHGADGGPLTTTSSRLIVVARK
jgi:SAM-dependent methyltransferase